MVSSRADARPLAVLRIAVGVASVVKALRTYPVLTELSRGDVLRMPLVELPLPAPWAASTLIGAWAACGILLALGWRHRVWALGSAAIVAYVLTLDQQLYSNHLYLLAWLAALLAFSGASTVWAPGRPGLATVPSWQLMPLRTQVTVVYLFAGLSKFNVAFLSGALIYAEFPNFREQLPVSVFIALAVSAVMVELFVAVGLWFSPTRRAAVVAGVGLHTSIAAFMTPTVDLAVFALLMISAYPLFREWTAPNPHNATVPLEDENRIEPVFD